MRTTTPVPPGLWAPYRCSTLTGKLYWIVRRDAEGEDGGWQALTTPAGRMRRFGSADAAAKAADAANKP